MVPNTVQPITPSRDRLSRNFASNGDDFVLASGNAPLAAAGFLQTASPMPGATMFSDTGKLFTRDNN
jgi:hypothetical protein